MLSRYYIQHCCFRGDRGLVVVVVVLEETLFCSQYMYHLQCTECTACTASVPRVPRVYRVHVPGVPWEHPGVSVYILVSVDIQTDTIKWTY